jgi:hypothetical protein
MKKQKGILTIVFFALVSSAFSQNIPTVRTTEWNIAGYEGEIPCLSVLRNVVTEFKIDNTGATDVSAKVQTAVNAIKDNEVLYFPNGTYLFNNTVNVPSKRVIRGESPDSTIFNFNMGGDFNLFYTAGTKGADITISAIQAHGGNTLTAASTSGLNVGDDIEIEQENDPAIHYIESASDNVTWAQNIKGQILKIAAVNGNVITVDRTFTFDYDLNFAMRLRKITAATNVGYENFYIKRMDADAGVSTNNNFNFIYANNCWMRRVHSYYTARYHVRIDHSRNIEVRECEIEMADDCAAGGAAYGVLTEIHTEDCLIEDNVFHDIRHPLIAKQGASRNVYAYNYTYNMRNNSTCNSDPLNPYADISLHGHYPAYNLYEGNIVSRVTISDSWGPAGPCNTIFRNRVTTANGIWTQSYSHNQNIYANEVIAPAIVADNRDKTVTGTLLIANNIQGTVDKAATSTVENSLYLTTKPSFFGALPWPSLGSGNTPGSGTIPAKVRAEAGKAIPSTQLCSACQIPDLGPIKSLCGASSVTLKSNVSATNRTFTWYKESTLLPSQTTKDISVSAAGTYKVVADSVGCVNSAQVVVSSVLVCDLGADFTLCNPSVKTIDAGSADVSNVTYKWNTGETTKTLDVISVGTYTVSVSASGCPTVSDQVVAASGLLSVTGANLSAPGIATISVNGSSLYKWYNAITNGTLLSTGSSYSPTVNSTSIYYVEDANGVTTTFGNSTISTNGYYNADNTVRYYFDVSRNLMINEITVFAQAAQTVVINFYDASNTVIKSVSQAVAAGEQIIVCNVSIPIGTGYYVDMTGTTGKLWRDKQDGVFPYTVAGVITINQTYPTYLITNGYYAFWYKWKITAGNACARTAVKVTVSNANTNTQTVQLQKGWNLISLNRTPTDSSISTLFAGLDVQEIKTAEAFWRKGQNVAFNSLQKLTIGDGYLVNMNAAETINIVGMPTVETRLIASLPNGWNLIGCPYQTATALSSLFNATNTQVVKNFDGFWIPSGSTNSITTVDPGKGYFLKK